ncbi:MAG TPA: 2OG-Fe(II) oxygenase family protein [Blastocatellia bacterium]|nr:2OG-Fe(II) oxygenase family protein [Blastocatellia bacterium]
MTDRKRLNCWIKPAHLQTRAVESYADRFACHPARLIVLDDFLRDEVAASLNRFLTTEAAFKISYGVYSDKDSSGTIADVSRQDWIKAKDRERFFRFRQLSGARLDCRHSERTATAHDFFEAVRGPDFRRYFQTICGAELKTVKMNAYSYRRGDFLRAHSDDDNLKRLAFVFYLSAGWERSFGGELTMIGPDGRVTEVESRFNSLVLFDVTAGTEHYVNKIKWSAGEAARVSIGGWFYS